MKEYLLRVKLSKGNYSKVSTIGIFDVFQDAVNSGNELVDFLNEKSGSTYHQAYKHIPLSSSEDWNFGFPVISSGNYYSISRLFSFTVSIETLEYTDIELAINELL